MLLREGQDSYLHCKPLHDARQEQCIFFDRRSIHKNKSGHKAEAGSLGTGKRASLKPYPILNPDITLCAPGTYTHRMQRPCRSRQDFTMAFSTHSRCVR